MFFDFYNLVRAPSADSARPPYEQHKSSEDSLTVIPGGDVLGEHMYNLPRVQAGMSSQSYEGLFLGSQELRLRHFHTTLDGYIERGS